MAESRKFEYGDHWLVLRDDTPNYYITWCRPGTRRVLRRSTGTGDLEQAKRRLIEHVDGRKGPAASPSLAVGSPHSQLFSSQPARPVGTVESSVVVLDVLAAYVESLRGRGGYESSCHSLNVWMMFLKQHDIVYVHELTVPVLEAFVKWRRASWTNGRPISNGTMNRFLEDMRAALMEAWRRGQVPAPPYIRLLPKPRPRDKFLTQEQVLRLVRECRQQYLFLFVMLGLFTLQRPSALLSLRTCQVDLTWDRIDFLPPGNTQSNKRRPVVPINPVLRPELMRAMENSVSGYVIERRGEPVDSIRYSFRNAARRAGIPWASPGLLRHTGATLLAAADVPLREISGMLGHTNTQITEEVYAKRRPEFLSQAAAKLAELFPSTQFVRPVTGEHSPVDTDQDPRPLAA